MEGENAWFCEELGRKTTALRRTVIKHLPQTLVIHLKRFEYDHINMQRCVSVGMQWLGLPACGALCVLPI